MTKPRIRICRLKYPESPRYWSCRDRFIITFGLSPEIAFQNWKGVIDVIGYSK